MKLNLKSEKMKKEFKETAIGKILTKPLVRNLLGLIPLGIGGTFKEFLSKTDTLEGQISKEAFIFRILKIGIYGILLYKGIITFDQFVNVS